MFFVSFSYSVEQTEPVSGDLLAHSCCWKALASVPAVFLWTGQTVETRSTPRFCLAINKRGLYKPHPALPQLANEARVLCTRSYLEHKATRLRVADRYKPLRTDICTLTTGLKNFTTAAEPLKNNR
ncbi:hypothetical protein AOLI_G00149170 [Acnodon oligacanthus]